MNLSGLQINIRQNLIITTSLILVVLFITTFNFLLTPAESAIKLETGWKLEYGSKVKDINLLPYYTAGDKDSDFSTGLYIFTSNFILEEPVNSPVIFLPYIAGNGIQVFVDDIFIGQRGDLKKGNASIWNMAHDFTFPGNLDKGMHTVSIRIYALYEAGILTIPFIENIEDSFVRKHFLYFYSQYIIEIISGILLILSLIFLTIAFKVRENFHVKIYIGIVLISIFVFLLDFSYIDILLIDYLLFKKITASGINLAIIFMILLINRLLGLKNNRIDILIVVFNSLATLISLIYPDNMVELRGIYRITDSAMIPVFIYIAVKAIRIKKKTNQTILILTGISIVFLISSYDILQLFLLTGTVFYTHIGIAFFSVFISATAVTDIIEIHTAVVLEKNKSEEYYKESLTDTLTGVYNRRMLSVLEETVTNDYSLIIVDLDKFKLINDTYGHSAGDMVLIKTVEILTGAIRDTDYILRYGGDEFLLILPGCGSVTGEELEKRLIDRSTDSFILYEKNKISFSYSSGLYTAADGEKLEKAIKKADSALYYSKKGK